MVKKNLSRPRLIKGDKWRIVFYEYDTESKQQVRHRQDFDLNSIEDLTIREAVAARLISNLDKFVRVSEAKATKKTGPSVADAVRLARDIKKKLPRDSSFSTYRTVCNALLRWLDRTGYGKLEITEFTRKHAREYWDVVTDKKYRGRTLNNYLTAVSALWTEMIEREIVEKNPFERIKHARVEEKQRRCFTHDERRVVAEWAEKHDYWMFRGILLQFFCYIRPVELSRLKFRHFNFAAGTVTVLEGDAKSYRTRVATIPRSIMHYFVDGRFERYHTNYYMYGMPDLRGRGGGLQPAATPANTLRMYKRHAELLKRLRKSGQLQDITGLSWYSWKDTGISLHARSTSPVATKDQAGHRDLSITSTYYHPDPINELYRDLPNDLF